jgi:hypothetical protein
VFSRQWRSPLFPPSLGSVYQRTLDGEPRTNNHLEGWHRRFKSIVDKHHLNVYVFLDRLKGEQAYTETQIERLIAGEPPKELRKKVTYYFYKKNEIINC